MVSAMVGMADRAAGKCAQPAPPAEPSPAPHTPRKSIYKITYPSGKIFIVKDLGGRAVAGIDAEQLAKETRRVRQGDFTVQKEILWESDTATDEEVGRIEGAFIRTLGADDPKMGYNAPPRGKRRT
jgi:hypothetical protein